ncbi:hypothetical protein ASE99_23990 [Serratia sp. Leaf51]|nr:hypothetical protein ASE99_23990 [Serratia sp. Leaf51]
MALNDKQVNLYMTHRKKGLGQAASAAKAGISVRSGRRIEKGQRSPLGDRHWHTREDPLAEVWEDIIVPLLQSRPSLAPITLLELLQEKYPGQYPDTLTRTLQRRVRAWKLQFGNEQEVMFRQVHQPGLQTLRRPVVLLYRQ